MSILSECLDYFVKKKGQSIAELAKKCRIDRSTMYQYIHGKRSLQNQELLETILVELRLTPEERGKVIQAYEVTQIGEEKYYRRKKVKELFDSLLTIEESNIWRNSLETAALENKPEAEKSRQTENHQEFPSTCIKSRMLTGEVEVQKGISTILRNAIAKKKSINLFLQPDCHVFLYVINVIYESAKNSQVKHIICLNTNAGPMEWDTLEMMKRIMRCGIAIEDYSPFYYYGVPSEHYGMMNPLPYFLLTEGCAVQIDVEGKNAIVHIDPEICQYFCGMFENMLQLCYSLMKSKVGLYNRLNWGMRQTKRYPSGKTIEVSSGLCSLQFWNRELIKTYLNPSIPGYKDLLEELVRYTAKLYEIKKEGQVFILMNVLYVREFIQTGILKEYPAIFTVSPLSKKDRKYILEQIFRAMDEGWYHVCFLEEKVFPLNYRWEMVVYQDGKLYMQYCINNQFRIFSFDIPEVTDAIYDYLQSLSVGKTVMDEKASRELMGKWMEEYLE